MSFFLKLKSYGAVEIIVCSMVVILQIFLTDVKISTTEAANRHLLCVGSVPIWAYPWLGGILYTISLVSIFMLRFPQHAVMVQAFAMALLSAPFVYLIIRPCYLAVITYVAIEFCINGMLPSVRNITDLARVLIPFGTKMYVYICYMLIDEDRDGSRVVIVYLIFDGITMFLRVLFASTQPIILAETKFSDFGLMMARLTSVQFACQAIVAQLIANI